MPPLPRQRRRRRSRLLPRWIRPRRQQEMAAREMLRGVRGCVGVFFFFFFFFWAPPLFFPFFKSRGGRFFPRAAVQWGRRLVSPVAMERAVRPSAVTASRRAPSSSLSASALFARCFAVESTLLR